MTHQLNYRRQDQPSSGAAEGSGGPAPPPTGEEQRAALIRLVLIVAAGALAALVTGTTQVVLIVLAIVMMIMLHELGHFVTAKWSGMKVTEFFLGFGPRLWSVRRGETEYGIKAILAGGYVKVVGMSNLEEVDPDDEPRTYRQQSYPRRLLVVVAGSAMHFVIAFVLLYVVYTVTGVPDRATPVVGSISSLASGPSPAEQAGFRLGDRIVAVDGRPVSSWEEVPPVIRERPNREVSFQVERDGRLHVLTAVPVEVGGEGDDPCKDPRFVREGGFIGIGPTLLVDRAGPVEGVGRAVTGIGRFTTETFKALGRIVSPTGISCYVRQLTGQDPTPGEIDDPRPLSVVGAVRVASQAADEGWRELLILLVGINIFVAILNMMPLLPFDGGHAAVATYERLRSWGGRRYHADIAKAMPVYYAVFLFIALFGITALYLDIIEPVVNPFE